MSRAQDPRVSRNSGSSPNAASNPRPTSAAAAPDARAGEESCPITERLAKMGQLPAQYPAASMLTAFAAGLGIGLIVTSLLSRDDETWLDQRRLPRSFGDFSSGLRRLPERLADHLPDRAALAEHMPRRLWR